MRPALLHLDCALNGQDGLARRTAEQGGWSLDWRDLGPQLRLWSRA